MRAFRWTWTLATVGASALASSSGARAQASDSVRDVTPPRITAFTASPTELSASGGTVTIEVEGNDNVGVTKVVLTTLRPDGQQSSIMVRQSGGNEATNRSAGPAAVASKWIHTMEIPANPATTPATWTFSVAAYDKEGNGARAGPITVTVAGSSVEKIIYMAPTKH